MTKRAASVEFFKTLRLKKPRRYAPHLFQAESKSVNSNVFLQAVQVSFDTGVINAQEFRRAGCHVGIIVFSFGTLAIKELKDWILCRSILDQAVHHLKESFSEMG